MFKVRSGSTSESEVKNVLQSRREKGQREELKKRIMTGEEHTNGAFKCSCDTGDMRRCNSRPSMQLVLVWCVGPSVKTLHISFSNTVSSYIHTLGPVVVDHMGLFFLQTGDHSSDNMIMITFKMLTKSSFSILGKRCCLR